jgi:L-lactate dehydrogenase
MSKVAIIGAGVVGTTIAYAVMMRGVAREIVLADKQADRARAEAQSRSSRCPLITQNARHSNDPRRSSGM